MDDLISRAAFRSSIQTVLNDTTCPIHIAAEIEQYLELEPAVDAVPVVRGRWQERRVDYTDDTIDSWQSAKCTNCGKYHTTPYLYYFQDYNFCPNCGAKMDGERRDDDAAD